MQIYSRSTLIYQLIVFCLLSPYVLHLANSLLLGSSALEPQYLVDFLSARIPLLGLTLISIIFVWRLSDMAKYFVTTLVCVCVAVSMHMALQEFNKVVLVMCFFYAIAAYYLLMLYHLEIKSAAYNPLYSSNTIGRRSEYEMPCVIRINETEYHGQLTNWDELGCFIGFVAGEANLADIRGEVTIETKLDGHKFSERGRVVSSFVGGIGIRFSITDKNSAEAYNWTEYYKIIDDRGYYPRAREA